MQAQAQLIEQLVFGEQTLRSIVDHMPDALIVADREGSFVLFNAAATELLGAGTRDVGNQDSTAFGVFLADGVTLCPSGDLPLTRALSGESVRNCELFIRNAVKPQGMWVNASASPLRDSQGALIGAVLVCHDATERKTAEIYRDLPLRAVLESEAQHRLLSESVPQLIWTCRPDGYCDYLNTRWVEYTGVPEEQQHGDGWMNALHPDDRARARQAWLAAVNTNEPFDVEYRIRNVDGVYRWFKARSLAFRDMSGKVVRWFGTSTDIDDQKRIEQKLARQSEELARSNADLQQFAYIAAHDLREPLRTIGSFTQLLARKLPEDVKFTTRELTEHIGAGVARMDALIGGLLSYAMVSTTDRSPTLVDCEAVLRAALLDLEASVCETRGVVVCTSLPTVSGDETSLLQLFQNLIGNALKYRGAEPPRIEISAENCGTCWRFRVQDNGLGIDAKYHEEIFGLFTRLHGRQFAGIGLGLAYCKKIVEKHHGRIWVESAVGKGSTFYFTLPTTEVQ